MEAQNISENSRIHRLILTEWVTIVGVFLACFFLLYSEMKDISASLQIRITSQEQRTDRLNERFCDLQQETKNMFIAMHKDVEEEMKDFHGRMCAIEERYREQK